jgi:hypothetical protein
VVLNLSGVRGTSAALSGNVRDCVVLRENPTHGLSAGGGVEFGAYRMRIAPEFRCTHWTGRAFGNSQRAFGNSGPTFVRSVNNQGEFLPGIRF